MNRGMVSEPQIARRDFGCAELLAVLEEQRHLCQLLLELSRGERSAIADSRVEQLEQFSAEKNGLVQQMELLEGRRCALSAEVAGRLGLPLGANLAELAAGVEPEDGGRLLEIRAHVAGVYSSLRATNDGNMQLMRKSLDLVRDSLRQLRRATGLGSSYTSAGKPSLSLNSNITVDRTA